jgi:dTDP-4-dehydrorhamnose reductase
MKTKILVIGARGMAGHVIAEYLSLNSKYDVIRVARGTISYKINYSIDITNFEAIEKIISEITPNYVINAIGILNKDAECNPDKAILINSYFPHFLATICEKYASNLIHISTDCVFDGKKGAYKEQDYKDGIGFYAQSKALGEVIYGNHITIRTSIIGPDLKSSGIGLLNWILSQEAVIKGYSEAYWGGVTTLELAKAIDFFIEQKVTGVNLFHLTNSERISKLKLIEIINEVFKLRLKVIDSSEYKIDKSLINTNLIINYKVPSYTEMIQEIYRWIMRNKDLYSYDNLH